MRSASFATSNPLTEDPLATGSLLPPTGSSHCHVCGEPLAGRGTAPCHNCHRVFHLAQEADPAHADCGEVWVNDQYLAMEFACDVCLGKRRAHDDEEPPVAQGH